MDQPALVGLDLQRAERIVSALEAKGIRVSAALWVHFSEYRDWRLVVAAKTLDALDPGDAYLRVNQVLQDAGVTVWEAPPLFIMKTTDPFIRSLRRVFGKARSVTGMRLGGQVWGDRSVEDAWAYKIA